MYSGFTLRPGRRRHWRLQTPYLLVFEFTPGHIEELDPAICQFMIDMKLTTLEVELQEDAIGIGTQTRPSDASVTHFLKYLEAAIEGKN